MPLGRLAGDAADHEPDDRPPHEDREDEQRGVARVVEDARKEDVAGLAAARSKDRRNANAEQGVDNELHRTALHHPDDQEPDGDRDADRQRQPQVMRGDVQQGERDRRDGAFDDAAPTAERFGQLRPDEMFYGFRVACSLDAQASSS